MAHRQHCIKKHMEKMRMAKSCDDLVLQVTGEQMGRNPYNDRTLQAQVPSLKLVFSI